MAKYTAVNPVKVRDGDKDRIVPPGEEVELDDVAARELLAIGAIAGEAPRRAGGKATAAKG